MNVSSENIRDFELCLYDTQHATLGGLNDEFIFSARLDNLMMSFCSLSALLESLDSVAKDSMVRVVCLFDNEEVGSNTAHGADSNFLEVVLKRLSSISFGDMKVSLFIFEFIFFKKVHFGMGFNTGCGRGF